MITIPKSRDARSPQHGGISVADETDCDGDVMISATYETYLGEEKKVDSWLDREGVRALRDHLTVLLGETTTVDEEPAPAADLSTIKAADLPLSVVADVISMLSEAGR